MRILSPATITDHITCGVSWKIRDKSEISLTYRLGFGNELKGDFSAANIKMKQNNIGVAYSRLF